MKTPKELAVERGKDEMQRFLADQCRPICALGPVAVHAASIYIVHKYGGQAFAAYDHMTDAIAARLMVRYAIVPA